MSAARFASLLAVALVLASVAACGGSGPKSGAKAKAASFLFVQNARAGSLVPTGGDGSYTLSLEGVDPHALYFSDRPERESGVMHEEALVRGLFRQGTAPPNAALELLGGKESADVMAFELRNPRYDSAHATLRYDARHLPNLTPPTLHHYEDRLDDSLPRRFGAASLFIDDNGGNDCSVTLENQTGIGLQFANTSKWSTDDWNAGDPDGLTAGPTFTYGTEGGFLRGCHNSVDLYPGGDSTQALHVVTGDPSTGGNIASCTGPTSPYSCTLDYGASTVQGPYLWVYWKISAPD